MQRLIIVAGNNCHPPPPYLLFFLRSRSRSRSLLWTLVHFTITSTSCAWVLIGAPRWYFLSHAQCEPPRTRRRPAVDVFAAHTVLELLHDASPECGLEGAQSLIATPWYIKRGSHSHLYLLWNYILLLLCVWQKLPLDQTKTGHNLSIRCGLKPKKYLDLSKTLRSNIW